ncbi:MAG: DUF2141 domain-containing protein [Synechococcales cyanobacterium C42_A2020_086]|nr:DUF2141 domain-containing protein [Synechococcales cyanobacterium M58_A2018_015]MBF2073704.1 DUF2141 domain-containing protein [Synechococcales cyanobacterium C42_A2020_086]
MEPSPFPHRLGSTLELAERATLTVELTNLRNRQGVVCVALFNHPDGYPNTAAKATRSSCFEISDIPLIITFPDLPWGYYAAAAHHDENQDGQLNCNAFGIPKEGIGFSSNPPIWKGVPPFQHAAFELCPDQTVVSITMKYLLR